MATTRPHFTPPPAGGATIRTRIHRPRLTADTVVEYLDWALGNLGDMRQGELAQHLAAAELVIRTLAIGAQGKATQHTLVESGVIAPPPQAS